MHDQVLERATLAARHDFDVLPRSTEIDVQPARSPQLAAIAEMGNRLVPGVQIAEPELETHFNFDPDSILTFRRSTNLLGAVAFIYFNSTGRDALLWGEINLKNPDFRLLAKRSDYVSAIYVWAIAGRGRAMAGLGNVSEFLSQRRFADADLFAHAASTDGLNLMKALGFHPILRSRQNLWRYERPWNRLFPNISAPRLSPRDFPDARY